MARFARSIHERLRKTMTPARSKAGRMVCLWSSPTDETEGETIAETVVRLRGKGYRYQDIAILLRSVRTAAPPILRALEERGIPASCGGRTGLFSHPEIRAIGGIYAWLCGFEWRDGPYGEPRDVDVAAVAEILVNRFRGRTAKEVEGFVDH